MHPLDHHILGQINWTAHLADIYLIIIRNGSNY